MHNGLRLLLLLLALSIRKRDTRKRFAFRSGPNMVVLFDCRKNKTRSPINCPVAALRAICKRDDPFNVRIMLADQAEGNPNGARLGIARQAIRKCHAVQFQKIIPSGVAH